MPIPVPRMRRSGRLAALAGSFLLGLATAPWARDAVNPDLPAGVAARIAGLMDGRSPVILGEIHGTAEVPALVGAVLAERVAGGRPVTLALEIPDSHQAALDAWLDGGGEEFAATALAGHPFWSYEDGRSSVAMLDLLEQVRRWRRAGAAVGVLAFDVPDPAVGGADRERHMADRIEQALAGPEAPPMLVLTGNLHARRAIGHRFDPDLPLMAWHLRSHRSLTVNVRALAGSAWICTPQCGEQVLGSIPAPAPETGLQLFQSLSATGYDGEVVLERFTASPPAFPVARLGSLTSGN
ncbi:MAG: hypothetical protein KF823_16275 [Xanthomonadales bacterium]|nr:hypothetical protein [Xanthomonadales bacterium]